MIQHKNGFPLENRSLIARTEPVDPLIFFFLTLSWQTTTVRFKYSLHRNESGSFIKWKENLNGQLNVVQHEVRILILCRLVASNLHYINIPHKTTRQFLQSLKQLAFRLTTHENWLTQRARLTVSNRRSINCFGKHVNNNTLLTIFQLNTISCMKSFSAIA